MRHEPGLGTAFLGVVLFILIVVSAAVTGLNKAECYDRARHGDVSWSQCD